MTFGEAMIVLTHKIRLTPTNEQVTYFVNACGTARKVFNEALAMWDRLYKEGEKPNANMLKKLFNKDKYVKFPWLKKFTEIALLNHLQI